MSLKGLFLSLYDLNTTTACSFVGQFSLSFLSKGWPPTWRSTQWNKSGMGAKRHSWCFLFLLMPMGFAESPWPHRMGKFSTDTQITEGNKSLVFRTLVLTWAYWGRSHPINHCDGRECRAPSFGESAIVFTAVVGIEELPKKAMCSVPGTGAVLLFLLCQVQRITLPSRWPAFLTYNGFIRVAMRVKRASKEIAIQNREHDGPWLMNTHAGYIHCPWLSDFKLLLIIKFIPSYDSYLYFP